MAEVSRNLQENFGLTAQQAAYRESEIRKNFGEASVEGYEDLIPSGIAFGWLRLASQSTTACALMHATCNLTLFLATKV